jgi:glycosyltransferase involved in cell wall biosynthesis
MSRSLKIGILGTRGIPNRYGGYEQCAEFLAVGLVKKGHEVYVYNSHNHEYQRSEWNGVHIVHCNDPEEKMGTAGQFLYDLHCINDARKKHFDIVLQLGYTSSSVWWWRWPKDAVNLVNMDGLEWKRSKYSAKVQRFLKHAEKWAAMHGDVLIADSTGIQKHLLDTYKKQSVFIPYGAALFEKPDASVLEKFALSPYGYHILIARMEPENNIEMIIKGYLQTAQEKPLVIVGKTDNKFGTYLKQQYGAYEQLHFTGGIYDMHLIDNLRYFSQLYFHGHSVGGTNPSLLEAMACNCLIAAHDNVFNRSVLGDDAFYFATPSHVAAHINRIADRQEYRMLSNNNLRKIKDIYSWQRIIDAYDAVFLDAMH